MDAKDAGISASSSDEGDAPIDDFWEDGHAGPTLAKKRRRQPGNRADETLSSGLMKSPVARRGDNRREETSFHGASSARSNGDSVSSFDKKRTDALNDLFEDEKDHKPAAASGSLAGEDEANVLPETLHFLLERKASHPSLEGRDSVFQDDASLEAIPTQLRRQRGGSSASQPGAVHVEGSSGLHFDIRRVSEENRLEMNTSSRRRQPEASSNVLVQAQLVPERTNSSGGVLVRATPDTWWRRWWIAGATAILIVGVALAIVLTTVGSNPAEMITLAPTSVAEGIEAEIFQLIVSRTGTADLLMDESTIQFQSFQWVVQQRLNAEDTSSYSESRVLQEYSLVALFLSTNGGGWRRSDGWLSSTPPCDWYGVECIASGDSLPEDMVVGLALTDNDLDGTLVSDVFSILAGSLRVLNLSQNDLSGSLSEAIGNLHMLTHLSLGSNDLSGTIPSSLASMSNLTFLDLSRNNLVSTVPSELGVLGALQELNLEGNDIVGEVPSALGSLANLVHLDLSENRLSLPLPTELGQLRRLETLMATGNSLLGPLPTELGLIRNLKSLDLSGNFIFNTIPTEIGGLSNLKSLDVSDNLLTSTLPSTIGSLRQLSTLRLQGNFLEFNIRNEVQNFDDLEILDVSSNYHTGYIPSRVWSLPKLWYFNASHNRLSTMYGGVDWGSPSLQVLDLSNNLFGPGGLNSSISLATNLTRLDLSNNDLASTIPTELGSLSHLLSIDLSGNTFGGSVPSELWSLTKLKSLNLAANLLVSFDVFPDVFQLTRLTTLRLSSNILSGTLSSQIGNLSSLESLWLNNIGLSGLLPSEIGALTALTDFTVADNFLSGTIPSEIGFMSLLTSFKVGYNNFTSVIPSELYLLSQLHTLDVSSNQLTGVLPTEIGVLVRMKKLYLDTNDFSGTIPSEVGLMTALQTLELNSFEAFAVEMVIRPDRFSLNINGFSGTIPSQVGLMTSLQDLTLSFNSLSGSIPTALGLLTELTVLQLDSNLLTGGLPSEIGLATKLETLLLGGNGNLSGTIPSELGLLSNLVVLVLNGNQLVGSLPSQIGLLSQLVFMYVSDNLLTGALPSEIGQLDLLGVLHLDSNSLSGPIPPELAIPSNLIDFNVSGTNLTGPLPDGLCQRGQDQFLTDSDDFGNAFSVVVDCDVISCNCCSCPTLMPSTSPSATFFPTRAPSTSIAPSTSLEPTLAPSLTLGPSNSIFPSQTEASCSNFAPIESFGTPLGISRTDGAVQVVNLPFSFNWRGQVEYSAVTVSSNGDVFPGPDGFDGGCCVPIPIQIFGRHSIARIATAQADFGSSFGLIYTAQVENAFVISWEGVVLFNEGPQNAVNFQVSLFENGNVELRWGEGNSLDGRFAAGLEDDPVGVLVPATGPPFDGSSGAGISSQWPRNQCRLFVVVNGGYTEAVS